MQNNWEHVKEIFSAALEIDAAGRDLYLDKSCNGDASLRADVEFGGERAKCVALKSGFRIA